MPRLTLLRDFHYTALVPPPPGGARRRSGQSQIPWQFLMDEPETAPQISYAEFAKLDIRMGQILAAEQVPNTDRLLRLEVKIGDQTRQLVAGIAAAYRPEEVIGQTIPILANLAPRVIRGIESQGMILCPRDEHDLPVLLIPERPVPAGAAVK